MNGSAFWNLVRKCASPIGARGRIIAVSGRREPLRRESGMAIARGVAITWFEIQKKQMDRKRKRGGLLRAADTCPISVVPAASVSAQLARRACGQQQQQHHQSLHCCAREIKSEKSTVRVCVALFWIRFCLGRWLRSLGRRCCSECPLQAR